MSLEELEKILNFDKLFSTKHHNKNPTRGSFGNAFKALAGAPYALNAEIARAMQRWKNTISNFP